MYFGRGTAIKTLKQFALAALVIAGLLPPLAASRPQPASAGSYAYDHCTISNVDVSGTASLHNYKYSMNCLPSGAVPMRVTAVYNVATGQADEDLRTSSSLLSTGWSCSDDPWTAATPPSCSRLRYRAVGSPPDLALGAIDGYPASGFDLQQQVGPFSTVYLVAGTQHVLAAQLQNALNTALNQPPAPAPVQVSEDPYIQAHGCAVCSLLGTPAAPTQPDFTVPTVAGDKNLALGLTSVYSIGVSNLGTRVPAQVVITDPDPPQTNVQVSIQVTGSVQYVAMAQTPAGWDCSGSGPVLCTGPLGGFGDPVQSLIVNFQLQVRGATAGIGAITVTADPNGLIQESDETNNSNQIAITVK